MAKISRAVDRAAIQKAARRHGRREKPAEVRVTCTTCNGKGDVESNTLGYPPERCGSCNGAGQVTRR